VTRWENLLKDVDLVKGVWGIVFGFLLASLTPWLWALIGHPYSDITLLVVYAINYLVATYITDRTLHYGTLRKGIATFFSLEFISWVAFFEAIMRFHA